LRINRDMLKTQRRERALIEACFKIQLGAAQSRYYAPSVTEIESFPDPLTVC